MLVKNSTGLVEFTHGGTWPRAVGEMLKTNNQMKPAATASDRLHVRFGFKQADNNNCRACCHPAGRPGIGPQFPPASAFA